MRRLIALAAIALAGLGLAVAINPTGAAAARHVTATTRTIVRPVTSSGHVAAGFTLHLEPNGSVNCSLRFPSPGAVSPNIEFCGPAAEYAIACWKAALAHHALCMRVVNGRDVYRIPLDGSFAPTAIAPVKYRAPLLMKLGDGDFCLIRDGGSLGSLTGHPNLHGTYGCLHDGVVWASTSARHFGVDESHPLWRVRTAPAGNHNLVTKVVAQGWFVGTRSS